jgi:hypothetical protein
MTIKLNDKATMLSRAIKTGNVRVDINIEVCPRNHVAVEKQSVLHTMRVCL